MSRLPRFFISRTQVHGSRITVSGEDVRHIRNVLRKGPGDLLVLLDGQGREYTVKIVALERSGISTEIVRETTLEAGGPLITLGQGIPKSDKMDFIVQKATELGVASIVPIITERTIVKIKDEEKRINRWQKIAKEAAMQSNRPNIPQIGAVRRFSDFLGTLNLGLRTLLVLPWEEGIEPIKNVLRQNPDAKNIIVLIGPEGGFSRAEAETAAAKGFHLVSLGPNILRTETAPIAVLSMIAYEYVL